MIIRLLLVSILALFLASCSSDISHGVLWEGSSHSPSRYATGITEEEKVALALERQTQLRTIRKWDYMTLKNNPENAIVYYQDALSHLPNDIVILRKLAHAYFLTKKWRQSYDAYVQVPVGELKSDEYNELFQSLFFDDARPDRLTELKKYTIDADTRDYYQVADTCYGGIHNCIVTIESYSGSSDKIKEIQSSIKQSSTVSPDFQYRNFLVATLFYKQGMYRVVDILSKEILEKRPNYVEVRKLRGFALYELGKYTESRDVLLTYLEQKPKDMESVVRLGEIYYHLGDYTTSNLYLNNAVMNGYPKKTQVERRLAYNYSALQDYPSMMKVLTYLLQEDDVTEDDYAVAVSLAIREGENMRAYAWSYGGMKLFPDSKILPPLYLASLRANAKPHDVIEYVESLTGIAKENPLIQLEYAIALTELHEYERAKVIFTSIHDLDPSSDWAIEANNYLATLQGLSSSPATPTTP